MLPITLRDTVLLRCSFEQKSGAAIEAAMEAASEERAGGAGADIYPGEQLLQLSVDTSIEEKSLIAFIEGKLEDDRLPFSLGFEMGFLFAVSEDHEIPGIAHVEPTLVWIAFPYMRELVADLTGRAPVPQYFLPPLTRLPQPDAPEPD